MKFLKILLLIFGLLVINSSKESNIIQYKNSNTNSFKCHNVIDYFKLESVIHQSIEINSNNVKKLKTKPCISNDGSKIAIVLDYVLYIIDQNEGIIAQRDLSEDSATRPRLTQWDQENRKVIFTCSIEDARSRNGYVGAYYSYDYPDNKLVLLKRFPESYEGGFPSLSPDGTKIAYHRLHNNLPTVWIHDIQTGSEIQISETGGANPRWSHNGKLLCYIDGTSQYLACYIHNLESKITQKMNYQTKSLFPQFSPSDTLLCYIGSGNAIVISNLLSDTTYRINIDIESKSIHEGMIHNPVWSPDENIIVFSYTNSRMKISDIYAVNIFSHALERITFCPERREKSIICIDYCNIMYY